MSSAKGNAVVEPLLPTTSTNSKVSGEDGVAVKTHWKDIYAVSIFYFFAYVTYQALTIPLYSYLIMVDKEADITFYGGVTSAFKVAHGISLFYFAITTFVTRNYRKPLIVGRIIAIIGCILYLCVEIFPYPRYVVLLVFILHANAEGSIIIVRSYVPRISTPADRPAAYGIKNGAVLLSIVAGPLIQLCASSLPFPRETGGIVLIGPWLRLHQYTTVIWLILFFNIAALYAVIFHIREPHEMEGESRDPPVPLKSSLSKAWNHLKTMDLGLVAMCMVEKSISGGGFAALFAILNPYIVTTFNYSETTSIIILSVASTVCGLFSIATALLFIFAKLGTIIPASKSFPISLMILLLMFVLSYPMPFMAEKVIVKNNSTAPYGCDSSKYEWCDSLYMNPKFFWLGVATVCTGIAMPFSLISQDTIYSRVLEGLDQNLMQAAYVMAEDVVLAATPAIATLSFKRWSPTGFWVGCAIAMVLGLALWIPVYGRLRRRGI